MKRSENHAKEKKMYVETKESEKARTKEKKTKKKWRRNEAWSSNNNGGKV